MTIRTRRRMRSGNTLENMTDDELQEVRFFGNLCNDPHTITFAATPEEVKRAVEILKKRGTLNTKRS